MSTFGKVLLADDSPHAQRMGERILREEGYEVVTVTDGETAILRVKDVKPDVVIVDAFLPQVSGYDLCGFIKKQPQHSHVRVLLTSTALERVDEDQAFHVGADGQLKKPFEASVMLKSLKDLISGSDKDGKKKRSGSTLGLSSPVEAEQPKPAEEESGGETPRSGDKGVSPLQAWLDKHGSDDGEESREETPDPLGLLEESPAAEAEAAAGEPVGLSNPQLLRNVADEPEDLSLRNNPVAKLRNVPEPAPADMSPRVRSISDRVQEAEPAASSPKPFVAPSKTVEEAPAADAPKQRRSLLDALAEFESASELAEEEPVSLEEAARAVAEAASAAVAEPLVEESAPEPEEADTAAPEAADLEAETAAEEEIAGQAEAGLEAETAAEAEVVVAEETGVAEPETEAAEPEEIAAGSAEALPAAETVSLVASGVRLDEEEIRAAVEIAVSASMESIVDEVTRCVTLALEARYRESREDISTGRASD